MPPETANSPPAERVYRHAVFPKRSTARLICYAMSVTAGEYHGSIVLIRRGRRIGARGYVLVC